MTASSAPAPEARDALFKAFGRAFFKRDMAALYETVTPDFAWRTHDAAGQVSTLVGREAIEAHFERVRSSVSEQRFADVVYHHTADATFMTFRLTETLRSTGEVREHAGIEIYRFRDGRIAVKDVYRKPVG